MIYAIKVGYCAPISVAIRNSLSLGAFQSGLRKRTIKAMLLLCLITVAASAQTATTTTIQSSVEAATLGHAVQFTATVSPASATGKVTFFDGVNILGIEPLSAGKAIFSTSLLPAGAHSITAFYGGGNSAAASASAALALTVRSLPDFGFQDVSTSPSVVIESVHISVGDFNRDGIPDLAVTSCRCGGQEPGLIAYIIVLLGNGDGTFRTSAQIFLDGLDDFAPAIADFNGDGIPDIATASGIFLGNGDGTFQSGLPFPVKNLDGGFVSVIAADFNGDGRADIAWSGLLSGTLGGIAGVALGNGDGTFQPSLNVNLPTGGVLALGDFNGDGLADLAMLSQAAVPPGPVTILLGNGDGTFQTPALYTNSAAGSIAVADFNGDGRDDLALASGTLVSILLSNPDGTFPAPQYFSIPQSVLEIVTGDFNGDGRTDLAAEYGTSPSANVLLMYGNGDGTLQNPVLESTGPLVRETLVAGDFNGDGRTDLASIIGGIDTLLGQPAPQGAVAITKVANAASFTPAIEAGSWVMIQGTNLAFDTRIWQTSDFIGNDLPTVVDGVSVTIDGNPAFVEYISPTQINVQAPTDTATGMVNVVVTNNGAASPPATAQLQTVAPALFMTPAYNAIASVLPNYTLITATAPAMPGDMAVLWGTGSGPTTPPVPAGMIVTGAPITSALPVVTVGGVQVPVIGSVLTTGTVGLYQITIQLPANVPTGTPAVQASIGGLQTQSGVTLFVGAQ